jgi:hypothetical protein
LPSATPVEPRTAAHGVGDGLRRGERPGTAHGDPAAAGCRTIAQSAFGASA